MEICFCAKKGGERDMPSLSAVSHTHLSLVSQGFPVNHVCTEADRRAQSTVTLLLFYHIYPPLPIILLLLSIHLFVCIPFPSCLLIVVVPHHLFLPKACSASPQASSFQQHLEALVGRPPGCSKNSPTPNSTCGPVQPDRGFHHTDDEAHSSFLSPHKSVGGLHPMV